MVGGVIRSFITKLSIAGLPYQNAMFEDSFSSKNNFCKLFFCSPEILPSKSPKIS